MKLAECQVSYFDYGHKYFFGDKQLIGVTSLMKKHGLSADYSGISDEVLQKAAKLGTAAHKAIEDYCNCIPGIEMPLIKSYRALGLNIIKTEYLISDYNVTASSIDLLNQREPGVYDIIDIKRTDKIHREALAWQLGIYRYLFLRMNPDAKVAGCFCLPIQKGNKDDILADVCGELLPITPVDECDVVALLEAEVRGEIYEPAKKEGAMVLSAEKMLALSIGIKSVNLYKQQLKEAEEAISSIQEEIYQWMLDNDRDSLSLHGMEVKLKRPYQKTALDTTRLKKVHPDLYKEFSKTSEVKGNITIKEK